MSEAGLLRVVPVTGSFPARPGPLRSAAVVPAAAQHKPKLLEQVRDAVRTRHYSYRTEASLPKPGAQAGGIRRIYPAHPEPVEGFIFFHHKRHPAEMGKLEIEQFLTALAVERHVSASTQNQALAAVLFQALPLPCGHFRPRGRVREGAGWNPGWLDDVVRAKQTQRLPVVLTHAEVAALLAAVKGVRWLMAMLLYGAGLRLKECLRLRVQEIEFSRNEILVRNGKGQKDRVTMLPAAVKEPLAAHLERVQRQHAMDLQAGLGRVQLPDALARKYPNADREWGWQWVFPATTISADPRSGERRRHHQHETVPQRAIREARRRAGIVKPVGSHTPLILSSEAYRRTLLCDTSVGCRLRYPHGAGTAGTSRREDDHDLHPRAQPRRPWRAEPCGRPARQRQSGVIASAMRFVSESSVEGRSRRKSLDAQRKVARSRQRRRGGYEALSAWVAHFIRTSKCSSAMARRTFGLHLIAMALITTAHTAQAGINVWTSHGPEGARVYALAIDPTTPTTLYAGADGGLFKSTDSGGTWGAVNTGLPLANVYALATDPTTPSTLYAGTSSGVFKSTDSGGTWGAVNTGLTSTFVLALALDAAAPTTLYAGTLVSGVFKSTDGGSTWGAVNTGLTSTTVYAVISDRSTPSTLYAGTDGGVFKSTDGGDTWSGTSLSSYYVGALAIDPATPTTLYAWMGVGTYGLFGVFKSTDGGGTWSPTNNGLTNLNVRAFAIDPIAPTTLYAGTDGGIFKSTDGGATWGAVRTGLEIDTASVSALAIDPVTPRMLYAGAFGGGVFKSTDDGGSWGTANTGLITTTVTLLAIDPATPTTLYAGAFDRGVFKSTDRGATWGAANSGLTTEAGVFALTIDRAAPTTLYAGLVSDTGGGVFKSTDGAATWNAVSTTEDTSDVTVLAIDPTSPATLYAGMGSSRGVFKSTDGGATWDAVNTGLEIDATLVNTLALDPTTPTTLYVGTGLYTLAGGAVFKSLDGAATWSVTGLTKAFVNVLAIDPVTPSTLYAGTGGGVFRSTDGGTTWTASGLPDTSVAALAINPSAPATLYAGTDRGVFKSPDGGLTWSPINSGLTHADVRALAIDPITPSMLYAGTIGGGVFAIQQALAATPTATSTPTPGAVASGCTLAGGERAGSWFFFALNLVTVVLAGRALERRSMRYRGLR